VDDQFVDLTA